MLAANQLDLHETWVKGQMIVRDPQTSAFLPDPMAVAVITPSSLLPYPIDVATIAIIKYSHFYKAPLRFPSMSPFCGNVHSSEVTSQDANLVVVDQPVMPLPLSLSGKDAKGYYLLYASQSFLRCYGYQNGENVWFSSAKAFPLQEVCLELIGLEDLDGISTDELEEFIFQLRMKCRQKQVIVKQDYSFTFDLEGPGGSPMSMSLGRAFQKALQRRRSISPGSVTLKFVVILAKPFFQGIINDNTEISILPFDPVESPHILSPVDGPQKGRSSSGSYSLESGLLREGETSPVASDTDSEDDLVSSIANTGGGTPDLLLPGKSSYRKQQLSLVDTPATPHIMQALTTETASTEKGYYSIEVRPFYREDLDKNTLLIPKSVAPTLQAWIGPVLTGNYVRISPSDASGIKIAPSDKVSGKRRDSLNPYYAIMKLFQVHQTYSSEVPSGSAGSVKCDTTARVIEEQYPRLIEGESPVVFLHPETLFSIFPHPTLPSKDPYLISLENIPPDEIHNVKHIAVACVGGPNNKWPDSVIHPLLIGYIRKPRCMNVGEVFSLPVTKDERCFFVVTEMHKGSEDSKVAVPYGPTGSHLNISASFEPILHAIPNLSYLTEFSLVRSFKSYWQSPIPMGFEKYFNQLLFYCIPMLSECADVSLNCILLHGPAGCGKTTVTEAVARHCGLHFVPIDCTDYIVSDSVTTIEMTLSKKLADATNGAAPCIVYLKNIHCLGDTKFSSAKEPRTSQLLKMFLEALSLKKKSGELPVVVVCSTRQKYNVAPDVSACFLHEVHMEYPSLHEREAILDGLAKGAAVARDTDTGEIARKTSGSVLSDLVSLVTKAALFAIKDAYNFVFGSEDVSLQWHSEQNIAIAGVTASHEHFLKAASEVHSEQADVIGAPKIPNVQWEDVGGLAEAKQEIINTIELPMLHPDLFGADLRRSGILLFGPPGTGKTLLAKAVASECSFNFLSIKGPELLNMYVGQSEQNLRHLFERAKAAAPCILFFDELDSLAPNRGKNIDSSGVMDRMVSQLLSELDGLANTPNVYVIGATNRPDLLDPALLRPGRFDRMVYLNVTTDVEEKVKILKALTRHINLADDIDLREIAAKCPNKMTGADLSGICKDAIRFAAEREIRRLEESNLTDDDWEGEVAIIKKDFLLAISLFHPSITEDELAEYAVLGEHGNEIKPS